MTLVINLCVRVPLASGAAVGVLGLVVMRARGHRLTRASRGQLRGVTRRLLEAVARDDHPGHE